MVIDWIKGSIKRKLLLLFISCLPVLLTLFIGFIVIAGGAFLLTDTSTSGGGLGVATGNKNLSPAVLVLESTVKKYAEEEGIGEQVPLLLAIMMVESGGTGNDPMQSSESAGLPPNEISSVDWSIKQGVKHYKNAMANATKAGIGDDWKAIVQAYNYGIAYPLWLGDKKKNHSVDVAEEYSRDIVAPAQRANGFPNAGSKYNYVNEVSKADGRTYLYLDSGNFFYAELVYQFIQEGGIDQEGSAENVEATGWRKKALELALSDVGKSYPTGWGQRGECIVAVQTWLNAAKSGTFKPGGVRTGYTQSGAREIPWKDAQPGDVIQYEHIQDYNSFGAGVHTMLVTKNNGDGSVNVVESNVPAGSGLVGTRSNILPSFAPSGWRSVVWRFPD
jgi:hypothetical protein